MSLCLSETQWVDPVEVIRDNTRSATPRSFSMKVFYTVQDWHAIFNANIFRQRLMFVLEVEHVGVFGDNVAAETFQGVNWNFTSILTFVFTARLCMSSSSFMRLCCSRVSGLQPR